VCFAFLALYVLPFAFCFFAFLRFAFCSHVLFVYVYVYVYVLDGKSGFSAFCVAGVCM
jgi:hypothetical protein